MTASRPFTDAHSIARLDFALIFSAPLTDELAAELKSLLRNRCSSERFAESEDVDDGDCLFALEGKGEGDEVTDAVHLHEHFVHVIWFDYRGWSFSRSEALSRLQPVLALVRAGSLKLASVGLAYTDVFFNDAPSTYQADEVLRRDSRYLAPIAFEAGRRWRQSSGWSERFLDGAFQSYSSLTIEATVIGLEDEDSELHVTEVAHRQQIVGNQADDGAVEWTDEDLVRAWDGAHEINRRIVASLLTSEMLERIGLTEGLS